MAKLSDEETATLKRLTEKSKAPDAPPMSRGINVTVDLGDEKQIERAIEHGFLTRAEVEADKKDGDGGDDDKDDDAPKRKGYFG